MRHQILLISTLIAGRKTIKLFSHFLKKYLVVALLCNLNLTDNVTAQSNTLLKLWYDQPANQWVEALPVGNGRLGAMVFGNPHKETVQLNENTVWAGQPYRNDNPLARQALAEVRKLIFEAKYKNAHDLVGEKFISRNSQGMPYQTVGNLYLSFPGHDSYSNYYRELNIQTATALTRYDVQGVTYQRELFASYPGQVIVLRLTASQPGAINFTASIDRPETEVQVSTTETNTLLMSGVTSDRDSIKGAVRFQAMVQIETEGGIISSTDSTLLIQDADVALLRISIASNFRNYNDISADAYAKAKSYLQNASPIKYKQLRQDHIKDFQRYFNRVTLDLGKTDVVNNPTDKRIAQFKSGNDPQLVALCFQYGRYLLISSSRPGGQPANLQGIWNDQLYPPWDSKYTVNINTEMNYWPSEPTNLSEMNEPLIQMLHELSRTGRQTATDMYGADGWVLHHNTDIWRMNGPIDGPYWGMWPMGGAWLSQHLFEKYEYSGNTEYLRSVYPVMKSACEFFLDFLVEEPDQKWLVVTPSISPENSPLIHQGVSLAAGATMDNQLLFDLFSKTIRTAKILQIDKKFVSKMEDALKRLPPMQTGQWGQLQEWMQDWDSPDDKHRHVSHLYGLFPSNQISPFHSAKLFSAAKTSLLARGDASTGWSMGWKVNLWARLLDGNHALKLISEQLTPSIQPDGKQQGGSYPNMFDAHPPFQIDGNFGFTAGVAEMLVQSHDGAIFILPALPDNWKEGSVRGLRLRGGFVIENMQWKNGQIAKLVIKSTLGGNCRIRSYTQLQSENRLVFNFVKGENQNPFYQVPAIKEPLISDNTKIADVMVKKTFLYDFESKPGEKYILKSLNK